MSDDDNNIDWSWIALIGFFTVWILVSYYYDFKTSQSGDQLKIEQEKTHQLELQKGK